MLFDDDKLTSHISQQFNEELEQIRTELLTMGGLVEQQVNDAVTAFLTSDVQLAEQARSIDHQTNQMELRIDQQCTRIIARRQPTSTDLRLIISVSKAVNDLERIGDEASRICRYAMDLAHQGEVKGYNEVRHIAQIVKDMVSNVLTAFARTDTDVAYQVARMDRQVDQEYQSAMRSLATYMMEDPRAISNVLNIIWVVRSLERIGDHSRNMAEHLIYLVSGTDVRHSSLEEIREAAKAHD